MREDVESFFVQQLRRNVCFNNFVNAYVAEKFSNEKNIFKYFENLKGNFLSDFFYKLTPLTWTGSIASFRGIFHDLPVIRRRKLLQTFLYNFLLIWIVHI